MNEKILNIIKNHLLIDLERPYRKSSEYDECLMYERWVANYIMQLIKNSDDDPLIVIYEFYRKLVGFLYSTDNENPICYLFAIMVNEAERIGLMIV